MVPGEVVAARVLASADGALGAYVHVPFCERICPFCPYNKVVAHDGLARRYFAALEREVRTWVDAGAGPFTSLYVGGGTPTLYPEALERLVATIPTTGERAIEVLPTHGTLARLDRLAAIGFAAVSVGAQSFHDPVLHRLRRPHDAAASRAAVVHALGRFATVDVDLIVDVAWEDDDALAGAFLADVRTCFDLGVDQVSTYPLVRFGYTPFGVARHDRRREHEVLHAAGRLAAQSGYERRSVWTFNRVGSAAYTSITRPRFLGLGAGAASFTGLDLHVNHFGLGAYCAALEEGRLPIARRFHLGTAGGAAYDAFWQAYAGGVDAGRLRRRFGAPGVAAAAVLPAMRAGGLVLPAPGGYRLTPRGYDLHHDLERWVTSSFIEPLWAEMLAEHGDTAGWAAPSRSRTGLAWRTARALLERTDERAGHRSGPRCVRHQGLEPRTR